MLSQRRVLFSDDADRSATAGRSASMVGELVEVEGLSAREFVPVPNRDNDEHLGSLGQVIDIRHTAGAVSSKPRQLILVGGNDHDMRTNMEVLIRRLAWRILVRHPRTSVHVGDADPVEVSRSPRKAILYPLQEE